MIPPVMEEFASEEDLANGIALNGTLRQGAKGEKVLQLQLCH